MTKDSYDMRGPFDAKEARAWLMFFGKILAVVVVVTVFVIDRIDNKSKQKEYRSTLEEYYGGVEQGKGAAIAGSSQALRAILKQEVSGKLESLEKEVGRQVVKIEDLEKEALYLRTHVEENGKNIAKIQGIIERIASGPTSLAKVNGR